MTIRMKKLGWVALLAAGFLALAGIGKCARDPLPIIFVHGGSGSGAQFESQQMRFTTNGYEQERINVVEYDSNLPFPEEIEVVHAEIDAKVAELKAEFGVDAVVLMGHSRGTTVSHDYLSFPDRAANIAKYVNIDGRTGDEPPGGVDTLAIWAGTGTPGREIVGAVNVTLEDQHHVQAATSPEAFAAMFEFLNDHPPFTTRVLPQFRPEVAGRVTLFPDNVGLDGATLEVWRVDRETGEHVGHSPVATFDIDSEGFFGPFKVWNGVYHDFLVTREGEVDVHYYYEPFIRDDHLVRLNVADGLTPFITESPDQVDVTVTRFKEFRGDRPGTNDILEIDGINVVNDTVFATTSNAAASVAYFAFDVGTDQVSNLTMIPFPFSVLAFITASDYFIPTAAEGPIQIVTVPRGDLTKMRTINVPRVPADEGRVAVQLYDFEP